MISLIKELPEIQDTDSAELIKIKCLFDAYSDIALFWSQEGTKTLICMLDGNMVIYSRNPDTDELKSFVSVISPKSVFSDLNTLKALDLEITQEALVFKRQCDIPLIISPDELKSDEIYSILNVKELSLPQYDSFAVDYCLRKNLGQLKAFAKRDVFAAISIESGNVCLINGIASNIKGMGSIALNSPKTRVK